MVLGRRKEYAHEQGRFWIAIGPKVLNPSFRDNQNPHADIIGNWNVRIDAVVVDSKGTEYYIPCVPGDVKAHTYSNGIYQTGYAFPNGTDYTPNDTDGNAIEFIGLHLTSTNQNNAEGLSKYKLVRIVVSSWY